MNFYGYEQLFFLLIMNPQYQLKYVYVFFFFFNFSVV